MKKIFLWVILSMPVRYAICQSIYGIKAGANVSNQYRTFTTPQNPASQSQKTKALLGYQAGAFYKFQAKHRLSFSAEANLSVIGSRVGYLTEEQILNPDSKSHYFNDKIGYIEIPLTLQYNVNNLYFGVGPSLAFNIFSKVTNFENRRFGGFDYRKIDVGGNILAGYNISKRLGINLRYSHGMLNISGDGSNSKIKNRFLNLSILYSVRSAHL